MIEKIKLVGLDDFDVLEKSIINDIANKSYNKVLRDVKNAVLVLHAKKYSKDGTRNKFSIHARVESAETLVANSEASDWKLEKALHKTMEKIENGINHKFKTKKRRTKASDID